MPSQPAPGLAEHSALQAPASANGSSPAARTRLGARSVYAYALSTATTTTTTTLCYIAQYRTCSVHPPQNKQPIGRAPQNPCVQCAILYCTCTSVSAAASSDFRRTGDIRCGVVQCSWCVHPRPSCAETTTPHRRSL